MIIMKEPVVQESDLVLKAPRKPHTYRMSFGMAFATEDNKQVAAFTSCRDYMHDQIRTFINDKKRVKDDGHTYYPEAGDPDIDMSRLRLIFMLPHTNFAKFNHGLKVLNSFEKAAGMELSTAKQVYIGEKTKTSAGYVLLEGSGEYMNNPHLLSLVTLTIRFCFYNEDFEVVDENSLTKAYPKINPSKDRGLMKFCYPIIQHVLIRREELFEGISLKELFPVKIRYNFHSKGGIQNLCCAVSNNSEVNDRINSLKKEFKVLKEEG